MEAKYLFVGLTFVLTFGFFLTLSASSSQDIMEHWSERRCDFDVIMTSFMYKPEEDHRSRSEFASENFKFCISSKTTNYLQAIFGVLFEALKKQMGASDIMTQVFTVLRVQLNSIYKPFSGLMNRFWVKFRQVGGLASRVFQHLYMSMKKAAATALASLYIALSVQTAFLNSIDLIIKIIMIVLYILMALVVIFFIPILPFLVIVLITVAGIEQAMPGATGPMGSVFCFSRYTNVIMKGGMKKHIYTLVPGDILENDTIVQAVVEVPSETLYSIDNILVSGYHSMYDNGKRIYVKDHPRAILTDIKEPTLWTLVTSKREIPIMGSNGPLRFLDWDEIPNSIAANSSWNTVVNEILNGSDYKIHIVPNTPPCIDSSARVKTHQGDLIPISDVRIGMWIHDETGWTMVTGKCIRNVDSAILMEGTYITDGNWILDKTRKWNHPRDTPITICFTGVQLITQSGSFKIFLKSGKDIIVRDFTEVGSNQIFESDFRVEAMNKKDADKEEDEALNVSRRNNFTCSCSPPSFS